MEKPFLALISVVDDDTSVGDATASLLRSHGFAVATFQSAAKFLASQERERTRLLILDVCMPGMTGLELFRELKRTQRPIPTIFISGHGTEQDRAAALAEGALGYLSKPFTEQALLKIIGQVIS